MYIIQCANPGETLKRVLSRVCFTLSEEITVVPIEPLVNDLGIFIGSPNVSTTDFSTRWGGLKKYQKQYLGRIILCFKS